MAVYANKCESWSEGLMKNTRESETPEEIIRLAS